MRNASSWPFRRDQAGAVIAVGWSGHHDGIRRDLGDQTMPTADDAPAPDSTRHPGLFPVAATTHRGRYFPAYPAIESISPGMSSLLRPFRGIAAWRARRSPMLPQFLPATPAPAPGGSPAFGRWYRATGRRHGAGRRARRWRHRACSRRPKRNWPSAPASSAAPFCTALPPRPAIPRWRRRAARRGRRCWSAASRPAAAEFWRGVAPAAVQARARPVSTILPRCHGRSPCAAMPGRPGPHRRSFANSGRRRQCFGATGAHQFCHENTQA